MGASALNPRLFKQPSNPFIDLENIEVKGSALDGLPGLQDSLYNLTLGNAPGFGRLTLVEMESVLSIVGLGELREQGFTGPAPGE